MSGMHVVKGYMCDGRFKLNIIMIVNNDNTSSSCLFESFNLWCGRIAHVNYDSIGN